MRKFLKFVYVFFIIGLESLGNMSAVMAILEENLVKKNNYVNENDIIDAVTLSRIGPGATTANAVAFLGNKIAGFWGGVLATICYTVAPMFVIIFIYSFLEKFLEYNFIKSAITGTLIYVCVLFLKSSIEMAKSIITNKFYFSIFFVAISIELIFKVSCIWIIIGTVFVGVVSSYVNEKLTKKKKNNKIL